MTSSIGIDPGKKKPRAVFQSNGRHVASSVPVATASSVPVFVEGQFVNTKVSRQSLMTLSFYAGLWAGKYLSDGHAVYVLTPKVWKNAIMKGSENLPKTVMHNRARRDGLIPDDVWKWTEDEIDAWMIAHAGALLLERGRKLKRLDWHG